MGRSMLAFSSASPYLSRMGLVWFRCHPVRRGSSDAPALEDVPQSFVSMDEPPTQPSCWSRPSHTPSAAPSSVPHGPWQPHPALALPDAVRCGDAGRHSHRFLPGDATVEPRHAAPRRAALGAGRGDPNVRAGRKTRRRVEPQPTSSRGHQPARDGASVGRSVRTTASPPLPPFFLLRTVCRDRRGSKARIWIKREMEALPHQQ
jgi:hypothetical protein